MNHKKKLILKSMSFKIICNLFYFLCKYLGTKREANVKITIIANVQ